MSDAVPWDVAVAGFGPVGAASAIALSMRIGARRVAIFDGRPAGLPAHDARMIAISEGSRVLLERLGAWQAEHADPIEEIHVSQRGHFGRTLIRARDYGVTALGYVISYLALSHMLQQRAAELGLEVRRQRVAAVASQDTGLLLTLSDGTVQPWSYLIHAEGGTFGEQSAKPISRSYQQEAVSAIVSASQLMPRRAFERFTRAGPIALLPCRHLGQDSYALVWCAAPEDSRRRATLDDTAFLAELQQEFGRRVGEFESVRARSLFPLGLNLARAWPGPREPAIGNAAQTLHPVAGQGFNLGLRDAMVLAETMPTHFRQPQRFQQAFAAARRIDRATTIGLTDMMPRAFSLPTPLAGPLLGGVLTLLDLVPALRHPLARQMMNGQR